MRMRTLGRLWPVSALTLGGGGIGNVWGPTSREEAVAYDVASALVRGSTLPELLYRQSVLTFGEEGNAELIYLVGLYCLVSVTLDGFDVPVPTQPEPAPA